MVRHANGSDDTAVPLGAYGGYLSHPGGDGGRKDDQKVQPEMAKGEERETMGRR